MIGEESFRTLFDLAADAMFVLDPDGFVNEINRIAYEQIGYTKAEMLGKHIGSFILPEFAAKLKSSFAEVQKQGFVIYESALVHHDGSVLPVEICNRAIELDGQKAFFAVVRDISERKRLDSALRESEARFRILSEDAPEAIAILDLDSRLFVDATTSAERLFGCSYDEILRHGPEYFYAPIQPQNCPSIESIRERGERTLAGEQMKFERLVRNRKGQDILCEVRLVRLPSENRKLIRVSYYDITERKRAEEEIYNLAFYDALTKLPNRSLLLDRLQSALSVSARSQHYGAVLFLDLDRFKTINDTLGHDHGDLLLFEVAERLKSCVREMDTVARIGGDEFVVLLEEISPREEDASQKAALIAEKIRAALAAPYQIKGREQHSSPSIGVCLFYGNHESVEELLKHADMAMYQAKDSGRNRVRFFDPHMQHLVEMHAELESDLHRAVTGQQLQLYYQIQVDHEQRPIGAEALLRWMHPRRGMVSPAYFIPIAEESSLILEIGHWVLDTACQQLAVWSNNEQTRHLVLAVNISAKQFKQPDFVEQIDAMLRKHHIEPSRLKLELTESVVLDDLEFVVAKMLALRQVLGVTLSLDDFGTGYSSLSYLKQLPLDQIKIDQSFVRDMTTDASDAVMVKTIIDMAQNFGLHVIAEGVETEAQLAFLKENGCMAYQGYLFSKPVPNEQFEALLEQG